MIRPVKIQIIDYPNISMFSNWIDNGKVYLDLDSEFKTQLSKEVTQLNDINEINIETALGSSFPKTQKNDALLFPDINYNAVDNVVKDRKIFFDLGYHALNQDSLRILGFNKNTNRYESDIVESDNHWIVKLKELYLDDLDFNNPEYTAEKLKYNQAHKAKYTTGDDGWYFGLVDYGNQVKVGEYSLGDFRPLIHSAKIYELIAKKIGYTIKFPLIQDTEWGARHVNYLLKEKLDDDDGNILESMEFKAQLSERLEFSNGGGYHQNVRVIFDNELVDKGNNYDPLTGEFTTPGYYEFYADLYIQFKIDIAFGGAGAFLEYRLVKEKANGQKIIEDVYAIHTRNDLSESKPLLLTANILVEQGDKVYVEYNRDTKYMEKSFISRGGTFFNKPISRSINSGDILNLKKSLRHDPVLDMIKGDVHLFNLKIYFERHTQTIHFLTPYDVNYYGDSITGFYKDVTESILDYQLTNDEIISTPKKYEKNTLYKFKKSTDPLVNKDEVPEYEEPYCKFINRGFPKEADGSNDVRENPYWEPTLNRIPVLPEVSQGAGANTINIPYMLDNLDGKISYAIGPRKLIAYGNANIYNYKIEPNNSKYAEISQIRIFEEIPSTIPYVFQVPESYTIFSGAYPDFELLKPEYKIQYGVSSDDLYEKFYKRYEFDFENKHESKFKLHAPMSFYFHQTFRNRILANGLSGHVLGRAVALNSFDLDTRLQVLSFIPDTQSSAECFEYIEPVLCKNYPIIITNKVGTTYSFSMGGTNESTLDSIKFEYKYKSSTGDFIEINPAELVNPVEPFIVRMTVTYADECKQVIKTSFIDPCGNKPKICTSLVSSCLSITECGTHVSTISSTFIEYSLNGTKWEAYNGCIDLTKLSISVTIINIRITVSYTGGCLPVTVEDNYVIGNTTPSDCPDVDSIIVPPSVIGVTVATGFELVRTGYYNCCAAYDKILYRKYGSNDEWKDWIEGQTPIPNNIDYEAKRVIIWCGQNCDPYCPAAIKVSKGCIGSANITDTVTSCAHQLKWENPDTGLTNWKLDILDDQIFFIPELSTFIDRNCGGVITEQDTKRIIWDRFNFQTKHTYTWNIGYKIESVEIHQNIAGALSGTITVPINVTYNSGASNDLLSGSIQNSIEKYLSENYSATNGVHYDLEIEVTGSTTKTLKIIWWAKHVVSSTWYGTQAPTDLLYTRDPSNVQSNTASTKSETQKVSVSEPTVSTFSPCGTEFKVKFGVGSNKFLNDSTSNFDTFTPYATVAIVDTLISASSSDSCNKHVLTASFTCAGTPTYMWKDGQVILSLTDTLTISGVGKVVTLYATCGTCTFKKQITLS